MRLLSPTVLPRLLPALLLLLPGAGTVVGADLVEPWDPGFTDLELHTARARHGAAGSAAVLGFGLPGSLSLGAAFADDGEDDASWGLCGSWTRRAGAHLEVDLIAAVDVHRSRDRLADGRRTWVAGTEWSYHRHRLVPYARLMLAPDDDELRGVSPLAGLMVPVGSRLEMHVELAADVPRRGSWPVQIAIGPNITIGAGVELLPEVAVVLDRQRNEVDWRVAFGVVLNPKAGGLLLGRRHSGRTP